MKAVVFGYGDMGVAGARALLDSGIDVALVFTHPAPQDEWQASLFDFCEERSVLATHIDPLRCDVPECDLIFSFYYKTILPAHILKKARLGAYNLHGSLLPKYRGRCPLNWAIINGEEKTGVTLHRMTEEVDAGDSVIQYDFPIGRYDTAKRVHDRMLTVAYEMMMDILPFIVKGEEFGIPQDGLKATTYGKRTPDMGEIDWTRKDVEIHNLVRAVAPPWPGAFSYLRDITRHDILHLFRVTFLDTSPYAWHWVVSEPKEPGRPGEIGFDGNRPLVWCGEGALYLGAIEVDGEYLAYKKLMDWCKAHDGRVFV